MGPRRGVPVFSRAGLVRAPSPWLPATSLVLSVTWWEAGMWATLSTRHLPPESHHLPTSYGLTRCGDLLGQGLLQG